MREDSQIIVPASFVALFVPPGSSRPTASPGEIAARHDFCEDLATLLTEPAATTRWNLGVTEADVLERMHRGLLAGEATVSPVEAQWVILRLAELLDWPAPPLAGGPAPMPDGTR